MYLMILLQRFINQMGTKAGAFSGEVVVEGCGLEEVNGVYKRDATQSSPRFSEKVYNARGRLMFLKSFVVVIPGLLTAILTEKALVCFCILLRLNALVS